MESLALRQLVEQFEKGALRRRHYQRPFLVAPGLPDEAALSQFPIGDSGKTPACHSLGEECFRVVKHRPRVEFQLGCPARQGLIAVEMQFLRTGGREIMSESLLIECRPSAYSDGSTEQHLERDDNTLPGEGFLFAGLS